MAVFFGLGISFGPSRLVALLFGPGISFDPYGVSLPGVLFGAAGAAGVFAEGLGALEWLALDPPNTTSLIYTPPSTSGKYSDRKPILSVASVQSVHVSMTMLDLSIGITNLKDLQTHSRVQIPISKFHVEHSVPTFFPDG